MGVSTMEEHWTMSFSFSLMETLAKAVLYPFFFNDLPAVDFILGSFGCEGSMIDFGYFSNEMMRNDDMRCVCVCVWVLKKK